MYPDLNDCDDHIDFPLIQKQSDRLFYETLDK